MRRLLVLLACLALPAWASAATYYVDCNANGDAGAGTGTGAAVAWKTIAKVNSSSFSAGDSVLFKRGCTFRAQLTVPSAGSAGSPITFGAYGTGAAPVITGADVLTTTGWTAASVAATTYVSDTFDRGDGAGWGNADGGADTDKSWNTAANFAIASNKGTYTLAWGYGVNAVGDTHAGDVEAYAEWSATPDTDRETGFRLRRTGATTFYRVFLLRSANAVYINKVVADSAVNSETVAVSDPGAAFKVRAQVYASGQNVVVRMRVWASAGQEPGTWSLTYTDTSSPITGAGDVAVELGNDGSSVAALDNFAFTSIAASYASTYQKALTTDPGSYVLEDGVLLTKQTSVAGVDANAGSYYWAANVIYINPTGGAKDPTSNGKAYETPIRSAQVHPQGYDYITVTGLTLEMAQGTGMIVAADGAANFTLSGCTLRYSNFMALWVGDGAKTSNMTISGNAFSYMPGALYMHGDSITVTGNTFSQISRCIELRDNDNSHCASFVIERNTFADIGGATETNAGILLDGDTNGDNADHHSGVIRYNRFDRSRARAIDGFFGESSIYYNLIATVTAGEVGSDLAIEVNGPGNAVYNNVIIDPENIGIMINDDPIAPNVQSVVKNNILSGAFNHIVWVSNNAGLSPTFNNNLYWPGAGATKYYWKGTDYTFTNWKAQSSQDANAREADPLFVGASDFRLQPGSPAINAGVSVGLTQDFWGRPVGNPPEIGAHEYGLGGWGVWYFPPAPTGTTVRYYP